VAHLVLPDEVQVTASNAAAGRPDGRLADRRVRPDSAALARAAPLVRAARRPVLIAGHGAAGAAGQVRALAELLPAPVLTTFRAKGLIPDSHPLGAGVLGRSGTPVASWLMNESDLLVVVGASFSNHTGVATYKPIADRRQTGRDRPVQRGHRRLHLAKMLKTAGGIPAHGNQRSEWDAGCRFDFDNPEHR
jgi:thiamine pyrophosphate-dependent acetolactate synthase large subunit-like protein